MSVPNQPAVVTGLQRYGTSRVIDDGLFNLATAKRFEGDIFYVVITDGSGQSDDDACRTWMDAMKQVACSDLHKLTEVERLESVRDFLYAFAAPLRMGRR